MVGMFSRFSMTPQSSLLVLDKKDDQVAERNVTGEADFHGEMGWEEDGEVELDPEFKPIERLVEPPDEDRPAKCPIPDCSLLNEERLWKEPSAVSLTKGTESLASNEESLAEQTIRADRKRPHIITGDHAGPASLRDPQYNIFQVFQQCKGFES